MAVRRLREAACALYTPASLEQEMTKLGALRHANLLTPELNTKSSSGLVEVAVPFAHSSLAVLLSCLEENALPFMAADAEAAVSIGTQTAQAIAFLHSHSLRHGCLWPRNVMLGGTDGHHVKLMDYGRPDRLIQALYAIDDDEHVLRRSRASSASDMFRAPYAAPEVLDGVRAATASADVYSLGCLLVRMGLTAPLFSEELAGASWRQLVVDLQAGRKSPVDALRRKADALSKRTAARGSVATRGSVANGTTEHVPSKRASTASYRLSAGPLPAEMVQLAARCCSASAMRRPKASACLGFLSQLHRQLAAPQLEASPLKQGHGNMWRLSTAMARPGRVSAVLGGRSAPARPFMGPTPQRLPAPSAVANVAGGGGEAKPDIAPPTATAATMQATRAPGGMTARQIRAGAVTSRLPRQVEPPDPQEVQNRGNRLRI